MTSEELRSDLQGSRERLFGPLRGLSEEQFRHIPEGESWNIAAHLAHLLRVERVFTERARRAITEDNPAVPATGQINDDDPALAQHLAVPQIIHGLQAARRELELVLDSDSVLGRGVVHERLGPMTVAGIGRKMADHEREHTVEIERLARQALSAGRVIIPITQRS